MFDMTFDILWDGHHRTSQFVYVFADDRVISSSRREEVESKLEEWEEQWMRIEDH